MRLQILMRLGVLLSQTVLAVVAVAGDDREFVDPSRNQDRCRPVSH